MLQPIVYIPIEIKNRDLEARLMVACHLVERGVTVVFGQQWGIFVNAQHWPRGVVLFKTMNEIQAVSMRTFASLGHVVAGSDEEVLTCVSDFFFAFSPIAAESCSLFFAQSAAHAAAVVGRFPRLAEHVVVAGNPRVELIRRLGPTMFEREVAEIKSQYGPYVLINANYAMANSIWGRDLCLKACIQAGVVYEDDPASVAKFEASYAWETQNLKDMLTFVSWAAANVTSHRIVVRPHPAERADFWEGFAAEHPGVVVVPKSHHVPWIVGADLVVHTSCTTGLETAFLGRPALNIERTIDPVSDRITSVVNYTVTTPEDAIAVAGPFLAGGSGPLAVRHRFDDILETSYPGFRDGGNAEFIAEAMCQALRKGGASLGQPVVWPNPRIYNSMKRTDVMKKKLTISTEEVMTATQMIRRHIGRKSAFTVSVIDDSLFMFEPK